MSIGSVNVGSSANKTASANIKPISGALLGFYVNSTSTGTIIFYDSATTTTTAALTGTITPAIGWHALPITFNDGLYIVIANTLNVTIVTV